MQPEILDFKQISGARRLAVEESLQTISAAELKALTDELFPYSDHPWLEKFVNVTTDPASGVFHHCHGR